MEVQPKEVLYYVTQDGKCPFEKWVETLNRVNQARVDKRIKRFEFGNFGEWAPVGQGVHELKLDFGPGYRIYFGQHGLSLVILLCAGDKKTQPKDIQTAHQYWKDWKEQNRR